MKSKYVLGGISLGLATLGLVVTPVFAQSMATGEDVSSQAQQFVASVSEKLGVSSDEFTSAVKETRLEHIDELLAAGEISEEKAAEMRERVEESEFGLLGMGRHKKAFRLNHIAEELDLTLEELKMELDSGKTIEDLAAEKGVELPEKSEKRGPRVEREFRNDAS